MEYALIFLGSLLVALIFSLSFWAKNSRRKEDELLHERGEALKRMDEKERAKESYVPKASVDGDLWQRVYHNTEINTLRVNTRQYNILLADTEFLVNSSGVYSNIKGMYRGQKVMFKMPTRKGKIHGNSNKKGK